VEFAKAIGDGGGEDGAETVVLSPEGRILFLEPEIDGGAVDRSFARGASDGGSSKKMVEDLELWGRDDAAGIHGDSDYGQTACEAGRVKGCKWVKGLEKIYFARLRTVRLRSTPKSRSMATANSACCQRMASLRARSRISIALRREPARAWVAPRA
jgi:hypothetical protein